ncbi:carboxymuconolactone decarboxylase family protein [Comamonas sp. NLF-1-9]|uniref:carboxymuconolactone decarboxylase family protein n=1 Tax=Comamonas sp. NLF-1-9 TaxID=2853163 RepID=UPI001C494B93|nr:carboxymuconolactone decarboxylase family protein [Comamonas sp. NLF-1-9]QXL83813.1 carboxymuconolactone decarboxylase family protein [Comamonas sp. NLF-1-9]
MHEQRLDYTKAAPEAFKALLNTEMQVHKSGLESSLIELVKMRASQINGCGYCLDMHSKDAIADGETVQRLVLLSAWREAPYFYSERERAALAWTEAITQISTLGVPDALYEEVRQHFDEKGIVDLTLAVIAINGWNRMAVAFRSKVGDYVSQRGKQ